MLESWAGAYQQVKRAQLKHLEVPTQNFSLLFLHVAQAIGVLTRYVNFKRIYHRNVYGFQQGIELTNISARPGDVSATFTTLKQNCNFFAP